jgi:tetratricopeptide (TPR) repeat protein
MQHWLSILARALNWRSAATFIVMFLVVAIGCTQLEPDDQSIADNNRGVALMGRFEYEAARETFAQLAERYPDDPDLLVNLAIATLNRQQSGDPELALEILDRALELEPDHLRALYCRGLILLHMGDAEPALECFQGVLAADPTDADAAYQLGQGLMQLGRPDEALGWYERAIELDPYLRSAYYRSFQAMQRLGERERGMERLEFFQFRSHRLKALCSPWLRSRRRPSYRGSRISNGPRSRQRISTATR